ncbi:MAG: hypothetical protein M1284_01525 [Candidatus Parvarchaeota archaeon]|jgi:hypothetical protein|nr:hypothetical protein [Candidatus Parvarchaeota archaeon]MCL5420415.1 hypothetical protein [Candidatus Parvarchaeota archaeon]
MKPSEILKYYLNDNVITRLLNAKDRECAARYYEKFGKRPMLFQYPNDVETLIKTGATSFHVSEERWVNPLLLDKELPKDQLDDMRKGWDLLIDVDCKLLEISKIFTKMIVDKIEQEGVKAISVKFSGGSGFHVLVPYESFPESINGSSTKRLFPDAPMVISLFLKNELKEKLEIEIKNYGIDNISRELRVDKKEFYQDGKFDPYTIIDIDTVLISERHMFRMQYSLNEKKWFVSVPIHKNKVIDFNIEQAKPDSVDTRLDFFDIHPQKDEAASLFIRAYDAFQAEDKKDTESADVKSFTPVNLPLDITKLPPCIKIMLNGLSDGRKRSIFILVNFLRSIGRTKEEITSFLIDWNAKNKPPLKQNLIVQQVEYAFSGKSYPPPNCDAKGYYKFFNVCFPDQTCRLIKNPLSYYIRLNSKNYKKSK